MKKVILFTFIFTLSAFCANAQLKVLQNGSTQGGQNAGALRIETSYRYVDIGCKASNGVHTHFYTNANFGYWFDKEVMLGTGKLKSYNSNLRFYINNNQYMMFEMDNGNVGIGYNYFPDENYKLDVDGDIASNGVKINSDARLKKEIKDVEKNKVNKLYSLKAKTYYMNNEAETNEASEISDMDTAVVIPKKPVDTTLNIGFIAQEVIEIFPELVTERENGYLTIDYISIVPLLVEALKEQNSRIIELENKVKEVKLKNAKSDEIINPSESGAMLMQNVPNPFSENTVIEFYLPGDVKKAMLCIYDLQGKQVKSINIAEREYGNAVIYGSELIPGMYHYSLIADGELIGIEKMILTD